MQSSDENNNQGGMIELPERGVLEISGSERKPFLQGLVTSDINELTPQHSLYAGLLSPQGKYLFDFFLVENSDSILLDCHKDQLTSLTARLTMYRLRSDVEIHDQSSDWKVYTQIGKSDSGLPAGETHQQANGSLVFVDPRLAHMGTRILTQVSQVTDQPFRSYDQHRLRLGVPDGPRDLVTDKTFWLESNAAELNGVSFTKGCYVGQEMTARMHHRTTLKKRVLPVKASRELPSNGTAITAEGKSVGEIRSSDGMQGIAYLRLEHLYNEHLLCGEFPITVSVPEWLSLSTEKWRE